METIKPMTTFEKDDHGNIIYSTDPIGNEIGPKEKIVAGLLLVIVTILTVLALIAHWPDKLPPVGSDVCTKYKYDLFDIKYLGKNGTGTETDNIKRGQPDSKKDQKVKNDTSTPHTNKTEANENPKPTEDSTNKDTSTKVKSEKSSTEILKTQNDEPRKDNDTKNDDTSKEPKTCVSPCGKCCSTIDLNTLILILVALAGFLGNMIHIASSFTNFIGAGKFKRSWLLWYWVKPFTASALAVGVYIIFRAGFLNSADATASVNLYGVVAIALLAGLFTDQATQKLKEVFGVIFQSSTVRPNPLEFPLFKITGVNPKALTLDKPTEIVLSGVGFENRVLKLEIEGEKIKDVVIQPNSITFKYSAKKEKSQLVVFDEKGVEITKYELVTTPAKPDESH